MDSGQIRCLPAGVETDRLVAALVFGDPERVRCYTTDIADAWQVVVELKRLGCTFLIQNGPPDGRWYEWTDWLADFCYAPYMFHSREFAETEPLAICRSAVHFIEGVKNDEKINSHFGF